MGRLALIGLLALVVWGTAGGARAQSEYIRGALDRLDALGDGADFGGSLSFHVTRVTAGEQFSHSFVATSSNAIRVSSACDTDCNRIQLRVVDFQNRDVVYEQPYTGASTLLLYPQAGQTYWVYAQPMDCSTAYCYTAVGIWQ